jgi:AcrR family transcriptional regulator
MRRRIVDAAQRAITSQGYAGTSVRSIASVGGFSPALVFYHFGSVDALLLAVLDAVSAERLSRYRTRLEGVVSLQGLAAAMSELYAEDLQLGQLTAVQEIVGAMAFDPRLGAAILASMQPWINFATELAAVLTNGSPLAGAVDPVTVGSAVIALYLGLEIVARMRGGDTTGSRALLDALEGVAPWLDALLRSPGTSAARRRPSQVHLDE